MAKNSRGSLKPKVLLSIPLLILALSKNAQAAGASSPKGCTLDLNKLHIQEIVGKYLPRGSNGRDSAAAVYKISPSGQVNQTLFEKSATVPQAVASTQKIVTAWVTLKGSDPKKKITFSNLDLDFDEEGDRALFRGNGKTVQVGDSISVSELLYTLIMQSSNGAAQALSRSLASASAREFVDKMNSEVDSILGPNKSYFQNPHGLTDSSSKYRFSSDPSQKQLSTASEMARLLGYFMSQDLYRNGLSNAQIPGVSSGTLGKPGWTNAAGKTYVYRFSLPSNKCGQEAVSMALFGEDTDNQFDRMYSLMTEVRDDVFEALGVKVKSK